jgi:serine protein kinase
MNLLQKLHLYDGQMVPGYSAQDLREMQRHHINEGMSGISPRHVMNRLGAVASQDVTCVSPLAGLNSMWQGLEENVSVDQQGSIRRVALVADTVKEYNDLVIMDIQKAYEESFEEKAKDLLGSYLANVAAFVADQETHGDGDGRAGKAHAENERDMREIERVIGITERGKVDFRSEIHGFVTAWRSRGWLFEYTSEPRLRAAIESRLLTPRRKLEKGLTQPRFARQRVEWSQRRAAVANRLMESYGYCDVCSEDAIEYVAHVLKNRVALKTPKNEGIEWLWPLHPVATGSVPADG